jgi:DNA polymerase epsilon subunit 1
MNVNDLLAVRKELLPIAGKNKKNVAVLDAYAEVERCVSDGQ